MNKMKNKSCEKQKKQNNKKHIVGTVPISNQNLA